MSIDHFYLRQYDGGSYNCAHFTAEVWLWLTGSDISDTLDGFLLPPKKRSVKNSIRHRFERIEKPKNPCIVLMNKAQGAAHVGLIIGGKVFHIQRSGVSLQPLDIATIGFKKYRFYDVKESCIS